MTKRTPPFSPEVRERAVRMVLEHQGEHDSQYAAIRSIAAKIRPLSPRLRVEMVIVDGGDEGQA